MCDICWKEKAPVENPTPIFRQLVREYQSKGLSLPWKYTVKPSGTIGILSETSGGIHPIFRSTYFRS